MTAALTF